MQPFEIINGPLTIYTAPVGESFPTVDEAPAGNWALVGTSGAANYDEDGVTVNMAQEIEKIRMLGRTGVMKTNRTEEDLEFTVTIHDWTLEQLALIFNGNTVAETAPGSGTEGFKTIPMSRNLSVTEYAILVRGKSAYDDDNFASQFAVPRAVVSSSPEATFEKGPSAGYEVTFMALEDPSAATPEERYGNLISANSAALP